MGLAWPYYFYGYAEWNSNGGEASKEIEEEVSCVSLLSHSIPSEGISGVKSTGRSSSKCEAEWLIREWRWHRWEVNAFVRIKGSTIEGRETKCSQHSEDQARRRLEDDFDDSEYPEQVRLEVVIEDIWPWFQEPVWFLLPPNRLQSKPLSQIRINATWDTPLSTS